jgi:uncharacterized protein YbcV (DUF1398 family)
MKIHKIESFILKFIHMFTIEQIQTALSHIRSGADFPAYIQDLIRLGVIGFETYTRDGHSVYVGNNGFRIESAAIYDPLKVSEQSNKSQFQQDLKANQTGKTDFITFCNDSARSGIEKWVVDTAAMICTYYDKAGKEVLVEKIPIP